MSLLNPDSTSSFPPTTVTDPTGTNWDVTEVQAGGAFLVLEREADSKTVTWLELSDPETEWEYTTDS